MEYSSLSKCLPFASVLLVFPFPAFSIKYSGSDFVIQTCSCTYTYMASLIFGDGLVGAGDPESLAMYDEHGLQCAG